MKVNESVQIVMDNDYTDPVKLSKIVDNKEFREYLDVRPEDGFEYAAAVFRDNKTYITFKRSYPLPDIL